MATDVSENHNRSGTWALRMGIAVGVIEVLRPIVITLFYASLGNTPEIQLPLARIAFAEAALAGVVVVISFGAMIAGLLGLNHSKNTGSSGRAASAGLALGVAFLALTLTSILANALTAFTF